MANITFIGDSAVGKTAIINAFTNPDLPFDPNYKPTLGTTMSKIEYEGSTYLLWDTGGQERYKSLAPTYYRNSNAAIFVYDVTKRQSFENIENWLQLYLDVVKAENPIIVVGNKIDLVDRIEIKEEEGRAYCQSQNFSFAQISAKTGENIEDILKILHEKLPPTKPKKEVENIQPKEGGCC